MNGAFYTREEVETLFQMRAAGALWTDIAVALNRSPNSLRKRALAGPWREPRPTYTTPGGWPSVGFDLKANDDRYVALLLAAAKLEGCHA